MLAEKKQSDAVAKVHCRSRKRPPAGERSWADAGDVIPGEAERMAGLTKRNVPRVGVADWASG